MTASSQQFQPGLVGGAPVDPGYWNPSSINATSLTQALASDPYSLVGGDFAVCQRQAMFTPGDVTGLDPMAAAGQAIGGALGSLAAGGDVSGTLGGALGAVGGGGICPGEVVDMHKGTTCDDYTVAGAFSESACNAAITDLHRVDAIAMCKIMASKRAETLTGCFGKEIQNLRDALQKVKGDFDMQIRNMQQYETAVKGAIRQQTQISETLDTKISILDGQITKAQEALAKINGAGKSGDDIKSLADLQTGLAEHMEQVRAFQFAQKKARVNRDAVCLRSHGASTSAIRNCPNVQGDLLTPRECILSIYRDTIALQLSGGSNRISPADAKKADLARKNFAQMLDQMLGDLQGSNPETSTIDSWLSRYTSQLQRYGQAGNQMVIEMKNCDSEAASTIAKELADPSLPLGEQAHQLSQGATKLAAQMGATITSLGNYIRDAGREVYGQEFNELLNTRGCNTAAVTSNASAAGAPGQVMFQPVDLQTQLTCAQGLAGSLDALLNGTPPPGAMAPVLVPLNVPGMDGSPARCKGLRDCRNVAVQLKAAADQKIKNMREDGTFSDPRCPSGCPGLKKFHRDSNLAIQSAIHQAADLFGQRVAVAKFEFNQIKDLLGNAGVDFPTSKPSLKSPTDMCPTNDESICTLPVDFGDQLSGVAGMPILNPDDFDKARQAARTQKTTYVGYDQTFKSDLQKLGKLAAACKKKETKDANKDALSTVGDDIAQRLEDCKTNMANSYRPDPDCNVDPSNNLLADLKEVCKSLGADDPGCRKARRDWSSFMKFCRANDDCSHVAMEAPPKPAVITGGVGPTGAAATK